MLALHWSNNGGDDQQDYLQSFVKHYYEIIGKFFLLFMLFILPMILDGTAQYFMGYRSTNVRRFITGLLAGIGIEIFF